MSTYAYEISAAQAQLLHATGVDGLQAIKYARVALLRASELAQTPEEEVLVDGLTVTARKLEQRIKRTTEEES